MRSSIKKQVSFGSNFITTVAQAAISTKETKFSLGIRKPKTFTKKAYFAKSDGGLISAKDGGYKKSLDDNNYDYTLQVSLGGAGRLFTVVFDDKEKPIVVLDISNKITSFSEVPVMHVVHKNQDTVGSVSRITLQKAYDEEHGTTHLQDSGLVEDEAAVCVPKEVSAEYRQGIVGKMENVYFGRSAEVNTAIYSQKAFNLGGNQGGIRFSPEKNNKTYY